VTRRGKSFVVVARESHRSRSMPTGTRRVAEADELEELLDAIAAKAGVRVTVEPAPRRARADGGRGGES